jgi:murein DD-endopeptidase MepM/ murein hydrolase activator NlpD
VPSGASDTRAEASDERPAHGKHADAAASTYTVAHGDTLSSLARKLHVSTQALADANALHGHGLRAGMKLHVPGVAAPVEVASDDHAARDKHADSGDFPTAFRRTYTVAPGDTLSSVSRKLHVPQKALAQANDLHGRGLRSGMKLHIPGGDEAPVEAARADRGATQSATGGGTYTVARGDTLTGVARRFHINPRALRAANDLAPDERIDHGMKLKLPVDARDHGRDLHASGVLIAPKVRLAAAKPTPAKAPIRAPERATEAPIEVADATPAPEPVKVQVPPPPARDYAPPRADHGAAAIPKPRPAAAGVVSGDTEGPPPAPGSPTFRAANDHAPVAPIHPPVTKGFPSSSELASLGKGRFIWPVKGEVMTRFGDMGHDLRNDGLNIGADLGATVRSAADGQVVYAGDSVPGFGNMVLVKHSDGWITAYGHLSRIDVKIAQKVLQGDQIGEVGESGGVERPQLHFEVRYAPPSSREKARPVDPSILLP